MVSTFNGKTGKGFLIGAFCLSAAAVFVCFLYPPTVAAYAQPQQPGPAVDVSLVFDPPKPVVGKEVVFTILVTNRDGGAPVSRADLPIMADGPLTSLQSMEMAGGGKAKEVRPGVYQLPFTFSRPGDYILHVHVLPQGEINMMRNHADFGPLKVTGDLRVLSWGSPALQAMIVALLVVGAVLFAAYRFSPLKRWLRFSTIAGGVLGAVIVFSTLLLSGWVPFSEPQETKEVQESAVVMMRGGSFRFDQVDNFVPKETTVIIGLNNTITWRNTDGSSHSVVDISDNPKFTSPLLNPGQTWTHTFTETGTYYYYCLPHPWMLGAIEVVKP